MRTCTNGPWGVSYQTGSGIVGGILHVYVVRPGLRVQRGDKYGRSFATWEEAQAVALECGYLKPYTRNTCGFVMSRAARQRGHTTGDWLYNSRVAEHAKRRESVARERASSA